MNGIFAMQAKKWEPLPYQLRAVKFLLSRDSAALFLRPGGRKTSIVLKAICELKRKKVPGRVLVIAPLRPCYRVWPEEVKKWEEFDHLRVEILHGPRKDEALARESDVCVINPEGLDWLLGAAKVSGFGGVTGKTKKVDVRRFASLGFTTLVIDELTKFKHTSSGRFKMLKQVAGTFQRRWGLTGSPNANGLMDLFGQCYILDGGETLGKYVTRFKSDHFEKISEWKWVPRPGASDAIFKRIAPLAFRLDESEYPQLPPLTTNVVRFDLPPAARKTYDLLENDLLAKVRDRFVVAANAAAASGKCRQVASGAVYLDPETDELGLSRLRKGAKEWAEVHGAKLDALEELIDELAGEPLLVGYEFRHDVERIRARIGDVPWIGGGVAPAKAAEIERAWNRGELPLLLGHPQSMGHGLNLQAGGCSNVCWFSQPWDYELYDQFVRRVWRDGTRSSWVTVHHLIARGTVEEAQLGALRAKDRGQRALFDALAEMAKTTKSAVYKPRKPGRLILLK